MHRQWRHARRRLRGRIRPQRPSVPSLTCTAGSFDAASTRTPDGRSADGASSDGRATRRKCAEGASDACGGTCTAVGEAGYTPSVPSLAGTAGSFDAAFTCTPEGCSAEGASGDGRAARRRCSESVSVTSGGTCAAASVPSHTCTAGSFDATFTHYGRLQCRGSIQRRPRREAGVRRPLRGRIHPQRAEPHASAQPAASTRGIHAHSGRLQR